MGEVLLGCEPPPSVHLQASQGMYACAAACNHLSSLLMGHAPLRPTYLPLLPVGHAPLAQGRLLSPAGAAD
eukprot:359793-Chlamydomonas_euryale.AAC.21